MEIVVTFVERDKLRTAPNPAIVSVGEPIIWLFRGSRLTVALARWIVYFDHGSPFKMQGGVFFGPPPQLQMRVTTRNTHLGTIASRNDQILNLLKNADADTQDVVDHSGVVGPFYASEEGDYKYGVRVVGLNVEVREKDEVLDDDDPHLIVRR